MNNNTWPDQIKEVGFDFEWDEKKVWALDVPSTTVDIDQLIWHLDVPFLSENKEYDLTPREVLGNPGEHDKEYYRMMQSDLIHPIDVMENKGRLLILDGLHRLMKAFVQGQKNVSVRVIPRERIRDISK